MKLELGEDEDPAADKQALVDQAPFGVGDVVEGLYPNFLYPKGRWCKATIVRIISPDLYFLDWSDRDTREREQPGSKLRLVAEAPTSQIGPKLRFEDDSRMLVGKESEAAEDTDAPDHHIVQNRLRSRTNGCVELPDGVEGAEEGRLTFDHRGTDFCIMGHTVDPLRPSCSRKPRPARVWLNVYDIDAATSYLNQQLVKANLGAFHCGVEVLGDEWFFAWGDSDCSGVMWTEPRAHRVHVFRESLCMGESGLSEEGIRSVIGQFMDEWVANSYHPISRNCVSFAEALILALKSEETFPKWVRGAMDAGSSPALQPLADCTWSWVRWYCSR